MVERKCKIRKESLRQDSLLCLESYPKLEAPYCLHLPVIRAVEIPLCGANMGMAHESLNGSEVIPVVQEGISEGVPHHMRVNPLLNQGLARHGFDKAIDRFGGKFPFLIGSMLPQGIEYGMIGAGPIPGSLQVIFDGEEGLGLQGDTPEFLAFSDNVNDSLISIGLEILNLQATHFGLS